MDERLIASIPTYDLVIRLVPDSHQMEVTGTILLPASGETRPTITLVLSSLMSDLRVELLEEGGTGVHVDATVEASDAKAGPTRWTLHPPNPIPANKPVRFRLTYASHDGTAFSFYIGPEGSFAGNGSGTRWYPQLPDNAARGTGQLRFEVPPGYVVLSNGAKHSSAASEGEGRFAFVNTVPTEFAFAAAKYTVMTRGGVVPMRLYLLRPRENAKEYVDGAAAALATLAREFGPYCRSTWPSTGTRSVTSGGAIW